jgi:hypothetical protein
MPARQSQFRKSGGFLNQVDATIVGYRFTDEFNGEPFKPGKKPGTKEDRFHCLYLVPHVLIDGAEEAVTTTLFAGGWEDWDVSEDGHTLTPAEDGRQLGAGTAASIFIQSIEEQGHPVENADYPEGVYNYEPMIGMRVRLVQRNNEEATSRLGKRQDKKTGKLYSRQDLVVETVYSAGEAPRAASAAKTAPKAAKAVKAAGRPNGKVAGAPAVEADEVKALAAGTLIDILKENSPILKTKLSMAILRALPKHDLREPVRKWVFVDDNLAELAEEGVISFDKAKQTLSAVDA